MSAEVYALDVIVVVAGDMYTAHRVLVESGEAAAREEAEMWRADVDHLLVLLGHRPQVFVQERVR